MIIVFIYLVALFVEWTSGDWLAYSVPWRKQLDSVIDTRVQGPNLELSMGIVQDHYWGRNISGHKVFGNTLGFCPSNNSNYIFPGPTVIAQRNYPVSIRWINNLPRIHILSRNIEPSLLGSTYLNGSSVIHVHGMGTEARFDGLPHAAYGPGESRTFYYPNEQPSATLVYHDHAMGMTRLNVWAGLVGLYKIQDQVEDRYFRNWDCDLDLLIQDRIIDPVTGELRYPTFIADTERSCPASRWVRAALGSVNIVNGIVMPYLEIPASQCRIRFINGANTRFYNIHLPFADKCQIIGTDAGLVRKARNLPQSHFLTIHALERYELFCDFRGIKVGTRYNVTDGIERVSVENAISYYDNRIFQVRIRQPSIGSTIISSYSGNVKWNGPHNNWRNLTEMWLRTGSTNRNITLSEDEDDPCSPITMKEHSTINSDSKFFSHAASQSTIYCKAGTVERWHFTNNGNHWHPVHWHLINVQCDGDMIKDVFPVPPNAHISCLVACVPPYHLLEGSGVGALEFRYDPFQPYVMHCHIMEHEENDMMTWFQLSKPKANP